MRGVEQALEPLEEDALGRLGVLEGEQGEGPIVELLEGAMYELQDVPDRRITRCEPLEELPL